MNASVANVSNHGPQEDSQFPAYGPIEAALGYVLFYVLVERMTADIVTVFSETVLDLTPSFVRFGLAAALWFVLLVTAVDQARRQLAALGVSTYDNVQLRVWSRVSPSSLRTAGYIVALVSGAAVATITFPYAVEALRSLIPLVASATPVGVDVMELFVMIVFFIAYTVAAHSFDRLVIGGVRTLATD